MVKECVGTESTIVDICNTSIASFRVSCQVGCWYCCIERFALSERTKVHLTVEYTRHFVI